MPKTKLSSTTPDNAETIATLTPEQVRAIREHFLGTPREWTVDELAAAVRVPAFMVARTIDNDTEESRETDDTDDGERVITHKGASWVFRYFLTPCEIEEALGADAGRVIPEDVRSVKLRVSVPRIFLAKIREHRDGLGFVWKGDAVEISRFLADEAADTWDLFDCISFSN